MTSDIYGQIIGFIALTIGILGYWEHDLIKFKKIATVTSILWAISYFLLGGYTSAAVIVIISIRQFVGIYNHHFSYLTKVILCSLFILLSIIMAWFTWHGWVSTLPVIASIISTISWFFATSVVLRKRRFISDLIWILNAIILHNYSNLISTTISIFVNLYTIKKNILHEAKLAENKV
jgi:uncharacterized membrane protein